MHDVMTVTSRLAELEGVIERGKQTFIDVGLALAEIRDSRLYREGFPTFEDYCREKWGWNASRSRQLIGAAEAVASMQSVTIVTPAELPPVSNEGQARELAKIKDPEQRAEVWKQVNEIAQEVNTAVTAKLIKNAVEVIAESDPVRVVPPRKEVAADDSIFTAKFDRREAVRLIGEIAISVYGLQRKYPDLHTELERVLDDCRSAEYYVEKAGRTLKE